MDTNFQVGLRKKFMRRFSKEKSLVGKGKRSHDTQDSPEPEILDHASAQQKMKDDWRNGSRCTEVYRIYMEATRTKRREEVVRTSAVNLIKRYPALRMEELVGNITFYFCLVSGFNLVSAS